MASPAGCPPKVCTCQNGVSSPLPGTYHTYFTDEVTYDAPNCPGVLTGGRVFGIYRKLSGPPLWVDGSRSSILSFHSIGRARRSNSTSIRLRPSSLDSHRPCHPQLRRALARTTRLPSGSRRRQMKNFPEVSSIGSGAEPGLRQARMLRLYR